MMNLTGVCWKRLGQIAMDPLIQHAEGGVYWSLTYNRWVGVRVFCGEGVPPLATPAVCP